MISHSQDHGFILRRIRFSETSLILWWLTQNHGVIRTMAKGALRPRQALFGKTDLFYECDLSFRKNPKSQLAALIEVGLVDMHADAREDYAKILALNYFGELITSLSEAEASVPELYDLFSKAIHFLKDHALSRKLIDRFERRTFQILGLDDGTAPLVMLREKWLPTHAKSYGLLQREFNRHKI